MQLVYYEPFPSPSPPSPSHYGLQLIIVGNVTPAQDPYLPWTW